MFRNNNIRRIPNPIRAIADNTSIPRQNHILTVGRLIKSKNHDILIKIFSNINNDDWKLIIVGEDALKQQNRIALHALIRDLKLEDRILLIGRVSDVESFYLRSKIFAFTSSSEGFPNVIGEAMSAGLPVISFDCIAGPSEMIRDGNNGYLIPIFDIEQFREKLCLLMRNEDLRVKLGKQAKEDMKQYSLSLLGDRYLKFILGNAYF